MVTKRASAKKATTKATPAAKKAKPAVKPTIGRPSDYSEALADRICTLISAGMSLVNICKRGDMPHRATVLRWVDKHETFRDNYTRAREEQADFYAGQIIDIADEDIATVSKKDDEGNEIEVAFDSTAVQRNKLRIDARKWYASKLAPKKYGEKLGLGKADGLDDLPLVTVKDMTGRKS